MAKLVKNMATREKPLPMVTEEFEISLKDYEKNALQEIEDFDFDSFEGNLQVYLSNRFFSTCEYLKKRNRRELTEEDYKVGFNAFYSVFSKLNEKTVFLPTSYTFAQFMGISEGTLRKHKNQNNERGAIVNMILDKLTENHLQTMQGDRINAVTGIFIAKAVHNLRDNDNQNINILNINSSTKSVEDIMAEYSNGKN